MYKLVLFKLFIC